MSSFLVTGDSNCVKGPSARSLLINTNKDIEDCPSKASSSRMTAIDTLTLVNTSKDIATVLQRNLTHEFGMTAIGTLTLINTSKDIADGPSKESDSRMKTIKTATVINTSKNLEDGPATL